MGDQTRIVEASRSVAVIPARGGSQRIPRKNIRRFVGVPLIEFAIRCALDSKLFDQVFVTTDDPEIAQISQDAGASVPFMRPAGLSGDYVSTEAVLAHALAEVGGAEAFEWACCIYPAAPFLRASDLEAGFEAIVSTGADTVLAVTTFGAPIWRSFSMGVDGHLLMNWPEYRDKRSQDLEEAFHDAGQFYWVRVSRFLSRPILFSAVSVGVQLPRWRVHDIDTEEDWRRAELVYRALIRSDLN